MARDFTRLAAEIGGFAVGIGPLCDCSHSRLWSFIANDFWFRESGARAADLPEATRIAAAPAGIRRTTPSRHTYGGYTSQNPMAAANVLLAKGNSLIRGELIRQPWFLNIRQQSADTFVYLTYAVGVRLSVVMALIPSVIGTVIPTATALRRELYDAHRLWRVRLGVALYPVTVYISPDTL
jgi:hypothetical protein